MPAGYVKLGAVGYSDKGDYSGTTTYNKFNVVHYQNGVYCCTVDNTIGIAPTVTSNWQVMIPSDNGHTILNSAGTTMTSRTNLQFVGLNVTDDSSNNKTVVTAPVMTGATALANGTGGLVPTPQAGDNNKVLRGDGTWGTIMSGTPWGTCTTTAATAAKTVTVSEFELEAGRSVIVKFANGNTAENMTLNVNNTGAKAVYQNGSAVSLDLKANGSYLFVYNGTQYDLVRDEEEFSADDISYSNTTSGLPATEVQTAIDVIDAEVDDVVNVYGSKNLNSYPYYNTTKTENGITFTDNGDGTITVGGTASANTYFVVNHRNYTPIFAKGEYILSGCPSGGSDSKYKIYTSDGTNVLANDYGNGATITLDSDKHLQTTIAIMSGTAITEPITFKPMIRLASIADDTYVPYAKTNRELTETSATQSELSNLVLTGATNTSGATIAAGTCFVLNGDFVTAKTAIASGATFTLNTNYEKKSVGSILTELNSKTVKYVDISVTTTDNSYVSPFSAYAELSFADYVSNFTEILGILLRSDANTIYAGFSFINSMIHIASNKAATFNIRVLYN